MEGNRPHDREIQDHEIPMKSQGGRNFLKSQNTAAEEFEEELGQDSPPEERPEGVVPK